MNMRAEMATAPADSPNRNETTKPEANFLRRKEALLKRFKMMGILEEAGNLKIWDTDRLREMRVSDKTTSAGKLHGLLSDIDGKSRAMIFDLLSDEQGVARDEYKNATDKSKLYPHPLLYNPIDLETAFDPAVIAADKSLMGYWEISEASGRVRDWDRELELPSGEKARINELFLSKKIFGDLKGRRDKDGNLLVWDEEKQKWRQFSANLFLQTFGYKGGRGGSRGLSFERPVEYLQKKCPELLARGLLRVEDFGVLHDSGGQLHRHRHNVAVNGMVYINGAKYNLGKEFDRRGAKERSYKIFVVELQPNLAGVVQETPGGAQTITHTFPLKSEAEKAKKRVVIEERLKKGEIRPKFYQPGKSTDQVVAQYLTFTKDETGLSPYNVTVDNAPLPEEDARAYADRMIAVSTYDDLEEISRSLSAGAMIGVHKELSWREQQWLATAAANMAVSNDRIVEHAKKFGVNFLKTFLACEYDLKNGKNILELAEKLTPESARALFNKYTELIDMSEKTADYLSARFGKSKNFDNFTVDKIMENMLRRGQEMLAQFAGGLKSGKNRKKKTAQARDILADLGAVKTDVMMLAGAFRVLSQERGVELKDVKGLEITTKDSAELSARQRSEMTRIFMANRVSNRAAYPPQWLAKREQEFVKLIQTPGKKFYLLFDGDNLLSFAHSEPSQGGNVYVGSFNTDPAARRNKIGSAFFKSVLDQVGRDQAVEIVVNRQNTMFDHYIRDFGFEVAREMEKGGLPYAELVRPPSGAPVEMLEAA